MHGHAGWFPGLPAMTHPIPFARPKTRPENSFSFGGCSRGVFALHSSLYSGCKGSREKEINIVGVIIRASFIRLACLQALTFRYTVRVVSERMMWKVWCIIFLLNRRKFHFQFSSSVFNKSLKVLLIRRRKYDEEKYEICISNEIISEWRA